MQKAIIWSWCAAIGGLADRDYQQKQTLRLIRRLCVLTQATHLLRPMCPVPPDLRSNAPPHTTLPDATWQRSLRPDATCRPPYVWTTSDSFSHLFFLLMRRLLLITSSPRPDLPLIPACVITTNLLLALTSPAVWGGSTFFGPSRVSRLMPHWSGGLRV